MVGRILLLVGNNATTKQKETPMTIKTYTRKASALRAATRQGLASNSFTIEKVGHTFSIQMNVAMTKKQLAIQIYHTNAGDRAAIMAQFATIGLSKAGSNTYFYAIKNQKWA